MAPKKKKKAASNPNRGFATTSQPSKIRAAESDHESDTRTNSVSVTGSTTPANNLQDKTSTEQHASSTQSIQDMSPEALEQHLEDAELQGVLDRHGARCKADSRRHVTRLENERRQSRAQSYILHPGDWLDDDFVTWSLSNFDSIPDQDSQRLVESTSDEKLLLDLWVLHRILTALQLPDIDDAIAHVVDLSITNTLRTHSSLAFGLEEALDWYAFTHKQADLPSFRDPKPEQRQGDSHDHVRQQAVKRQSSPQNIAGTSTESSKTSGERSPGSSDGTVSSDDDDDDPSRLTDRWLKLQSSLWSKRNQQIAAGPRKDKALRRIEGKITRIERDILFDRDAAEPQWTIAKITLQKTAAADRAAVVAKEPLRINHQSRSNDSESDTTDAPRLHSIPDEDDFADTDGFGSIFEEADPVPTASVETENIHVRDIGRYSGLSPKTLLQQLIQTVDAKCTLKYTVLHQTNYAVRHHLRCRWSKPQNPDKYATRALPNGVLANIDSYSWQIEMKTVATTSASSSADFVSALALFLLASLPDQDEKAWKRLPGVWTSQLADLKDERVKLSQEDEKNTLRQIRETINNAKNGANHDTVQPALVRMPDRSAASDMQRKGKPLSGRLDSEAARYAWSTRASRPAFQKMLEFRSQLPIYRHKEMILQKIADNPVVIVCAETGSGKSTQAGSYVLEQQLMAGNDCHILVTQPRRISAISLARRVSQEIGEGRADIGTTRSLLGYAIRMESKTSEATRLTFATTGVLLRMLETSPTLAQLDYLILDEVHERSMEMDLAFIALRKLQQLRPSLKIILMSATVNAKQFSHYFGGAPVLDIEGRTYPVTIRYLEDALELTNDIKGAGVEKSSYAEESPDSDEHDIEKSGHREALQGYSLQTIRRLNELDEYRINYDLIVRLATAIATKNAFIKYSKAILIFMPGIAEIRRLNNALLSSPVFAQKWDVHMLHSSFSTEDLERAFVVPAPGRRKVVIATNIAETGITIPDVTAVIDTCKEKIMRFDERRQLSRLTEGFTARSSAKQRRGRAARVQEGLCFHLVTKHRHDSLFLEQQVPEMLRLSLQDSIMRIKVWDAEASIEQTLAAAIDPPSKKNVNRAIERLKEAGALDNNERLTPLGQHVSRLPLDVALAKLAIMGTIFGCLEPILSILSLMTSKSIFSTKGNDKLSFIRGGSDQLSTLNAYESWRRAAAAGQGAEFARKHHLVNLSDIEESKIQLLVYLVDGAVVELDQDEQRALSHARTNNRSRAAYQIPDRYNVAVSDDLLLSLLATSFYPRVLVREGKGYRNCFSNQQVTPSGGSVIRAMPKPPQWLSFSEAMRTKGNNFIAIQEASRIPEMALSVFLGSDVEINLFSGVITIDGRIRLSVADWKQLLAIKLLRKQLRSLLSRHYRSTHESTSADHVLIKRLTTAGVS